MERPAQAPSQLPPGFRFHPTDQELVVQYLRRKALSRPLPAAVIPVVDDVAMLDPWDLPEASEGEGYFFNLRRAPAAGGGRDCCRSRRAGSGYWKATGKEKPVFLQCYGGKRQLLVGVKTTLAFHRGEPKPKRSPASSRTGWVMHEYRLALAMPADGVAMAVAGQGQNAANDHACVAQPREWVVCRVSLKKNRGRRARRYQSAAGSRAPGSRREDAGQQQLLLPSPPPPSSSSCVTGVTDDSDQDEVSSIIREI